MRNQLNFIKNL